METSVKLDLQAFTCAICLELLRDPVSLGCGHSFCLVCVQDHWDRQGQEVNCPQCRQTFSPRPALLKNIMLQSLVAGLKKTEPQEAEASVSEVSAPEVSCDLCPKGQERAVRSCLQCLVSYCETHLRPHYDVAVLQNHQLVAPRCSLRDSVCLLHHRVKELFCRSDESLLCSLCSVEAHRDHEVTTTAAERALRQPELQAQRQTTLLQIQSAEAQLKLLKQEALTIERSAQDAVQSSGDDLSQLILLLEQKRTEVEQQIRAQQQTLEDAGAEQQEELQQELTELRRNLALMDTVALTQDNSEFLRLYSGLKHSKVQGSARTWTYPESNFMDLMNAVSELTQELKQVLNQSVTSIPSTAQIKLQSKSQSFLQQRQPSSRQDFLNYATELLLDPHTAHTELALSEGDRRVTYHGTSSIYAEHPDRFSVWRQVLSRQTLSGRCYVEVEWRVKDEFSVSLCYSQIKRKGQCSKNLFGHNDHSWALYCDQNKYSFWFNGSKTQVCGPVTRRIGVYLDRRAGVLAFYSVMDQTMSLLHKVQTLFSQPLHLGLGLYGQFTGATASLPRL